MKDRDMVSALRGLAKNGLFVNHQERKLLQDAARRIEQQDEEIAELEDEVARLQQVGMDDELPFGDAVAPGEAAYDFWDDDTD